LAENIAIVISSPLQRAIQTALTGIPFDLYKQYHGKGSGQGIDGGATFSLNPDLQERSDLLCDTGSSASELAKAFPGLSFGDSGEKWLKKSGRCGPDDDAMQAHVRKSFFKIAEASSMRIERTWLLLLTVFS
jgi:hypothetical protein